MPTKKPAMQFHDLVDQFLAICPHALVTQDEDGELLVHTAMKEGPNGTVVPLDVTS